MSQLEPFLSKANFIHSQIDKIGFYHCEKEELAFLWEGQPDLNEEEKWLKIQNFATTYGIKVHIFRDSNAAIFHVAN